MAGQSNHFLITILVGLTAVDDGTAKLPPEMRTSWDPRDRLRSAARSREFAIKALLAWLVDALDAYIRALQQPPRVATAALMKRISDSDANGEGLAGRIRTIAAAAGEGESTEAILVEAAVVWRNRLVHQHARNQLRRRLVNAAQDHCTQFADSYQGLIIDDLIKHVESAPSAPSAAPTFKEVTAIVRSAHRQTTGPPPINYPANRAE